ncbi:MAG TPA: DUF4386 domain-containing protein [Candidatus Eisenbacteria bacterium]
MATARWAAALNILSAVPDGFSVSVVRQLFVRGDATATAANILGSETLFRLGLVADLGGLVLFIASGVLLYELFKPAGRRLALLYLILFEGCAFIQSLNAIHNLAALLLVSGGPGLSGLAPAQANAMALVFLRLYSLNFNLALVFGGASSIVLGSLILRATFVPRIIGPLMMLDGLGYLTFSLTAFLSPSLAAHIFPTIPFVTAAIGEGALYLWLIIKGVNAERWREQAATVDRGMLEEAQMELPNG